jgi:hypothetical protein
LQLFTAHAETTLLALMLKDNAPVNVPLDFIKAQKLMEVEKLSKAITEIHPQVAKKAASGRKAAIQKHNDKAHVWSPNFQVGDYVLVDEHRKSGTFKLQVKWKGPRRVASVESDYVLSWRSAHEGALGRARNTLEIRIRNSMSLRSWSRPPSSTTTIFSLCRRYMTRATKNKRCSTSC